MDLDEWINEPPSESSTSSSDERTDIFTANNKLNDSYQTGKKQEKDLSPEEINKVVIILILYFTVYKYLLHIIIINDTFLATRNAQD